MWMRHPHLPDDQAPAQVPEEAFADVWRIRGWEPCDPPVELDPEAQAEHDALVKALAAVGEPPPRADYLPPEPTPEPAPSGDEKE